MDSLLRPLLDAPPPVVYLVCFAIIAAETALLPGIVLPTLSTLLLMGFLAERGTLHFGLALPVAVLAAVLGDQLAYLEGRRLRRSRLARRVGQDRWDRAEAAVARYGVPAVIAGRCLAGLRTLVPRVAGSAAMPYRRFAVGSVCAAVLWASAELLAGQVTALVV
ncbi:membrane protein DedA, SNARE-associated domain [Amycolatopsis pretoriensis]|uniref:Membrane protein DedA, SNARE-associated domain n=1 Tax=Amycolatopsis pretoriensis TaxID=218821 RepID=A0A1H5QN40_9PSEU|nr:DedA family protein [Amycolatopsis pretoriensis]SEF27465.1 membrane protein DedA, SNARE-associated domain [Amycolatopsis pretoriensis]